MMRPFVSFSRILENIVGSCKHHPCICIIAGGEDKLVGVQIPGKLAKIFRDSIKALIEGKKLDGIENDKWEAINNGVASSSRLGVRLITMEGAAHHFQNDIDQEVGARQLLDFLEDVS